MRRLLPLLVVGFLLVGVGASPAYALSEPASTKLRALSPTELKALIADIDAQGLRTSGSPNVKTGTARMQMAAGRLAPLRLMTGIGVVAAGSVAIWKISDAVGVGGFIYEKITGQDTYGGAAPSGTVQWRSACATGCFTTAVPFLGSTDRWYLNWSANGATYANPASEAWASWQDWSTVAIGFAGTATDAGTTVCQSDGSGTCYVKTRTEREMSHNVTFERSTAAEFASPPAGATTVTAGTNDTTTPTDLELEAALDEIDPNPGTAGTAVEEDTAVAILDELEPGWAEGLLLQPLPNETYTQYITRLQAAGWVGDATSTELATETPGYGPEAVVRVIATPVGGTSTVYDPLGWPSPAPTIAIDAAITIRYNPDSAPEAPTTATPTPITGAPTTIPEAPALDFSPLTDIDFGCKFPYGFLCYAVDVTETFDVSPDAPRFVFDIPTVNVGVAEFGGGEDGWVVDLEVMDDWAEIWRDIWSVVIVIGAIYLVATRLLGFKAGGDPGEAMDDAL